MKRKKNTRLAIPLAIGMIALVLVAGIVIVSQINATTLAVTPVVRASATPAAGQAVAAPSLRDLMIRLADDDPYLGPEDAPVLIVEFSDYLCPWCGKFYFDTLPRILEAYPDEVRYVHRDYPVLGMFDADAPMRAAVAAGCAREQGLFWEMHSALFEPYREMDLSQLHNSDRPTPDPAEREAWLRPYTAAALRDSAAAVGVALDAYDACVTARAPAAEVARDLEDGRQLELSSVPTYIINGVLVQGAQSFDVFAQIIDAALADSPAG